MFRRLRRTLYDARHNDSRLRNFIYYVDRHIELDGDCRGPMGRELLTILSYCTLCRGLFTERITATIRFDGDDIRNVDPRFTGERFRQYLGAVDALTQVARERSGKSVLVLAVHWVSEQGPTIALWGVRRPDQTEPVEGFDGWHIDEATMQEIDAILTRCIADPASPEFMAPPVRRESVWRSAA
jgi:diketogulonate reductase-like aldo/keto reductase